MVKHKRLFHDRTLPKKNHQRFDQVDGKTYNIKPCFKTERSLKKITQLWSSGIEIWVGAMVKHKTLFHEGRLHQKLTLAFV